MEVEESLPSTQLPPSGTDTEVPSRCPWNSWSSGEHSVKTIALTQASQLKVAKVAFLSSSLIHPYF